LKIVKSPLSQRKSSDFDEIWYTKAHLELDGSQMAKYDFLIIYYGMQTAAILKIVFGHNMSAADCLISVKFCIGKQFLTEFQQ